MAYTPYQQALPDTTLYQRLTNTSYVPQGMRQNPYNPSMLSQEAQDYYADPFGFVNKRFGTPATSLDELLKPKTSAAKMFNNLGDGGEGGGDGSGGRNYYQDLEDRLTELNISEDGMSPEDARAAALKSAFQIQSANNQKYITDPLNALANFSIAGLFSKAIGGSPLAQRPANVTIDTNAVARAQQEREAATRAEQIAAQQAAEILARQNLEERFSNKTRELTGIQPNGQYLSSYGTLSDPGSFSPETTAGLDAARSSYGYGSNADYYGD